MVKNPPANAGDIRDMDSIPGSGRSPGEGNGNRLQYSFLENSTDRGAWWATVEWNHPGRRNICPTLLAFLSHLHWWAGAKLTTAFEGHNSGTWITKN